MSFGENYLHARKGRFPELASEFVERYGMIFVTSAMNNGPCLSTVGAPGGTCSALISVGAFVSHLQCCAASELTVLVCAKRGGLETHALGYAGLRRTASPRVHTHAECTHTLSASPRPAPAVLSARAHACIRLAPRSESLSLPLAGPRLHPLSPSPLSPSFLCLPSFHSATLRRLHHPLFILTAARLLVFHGAITACTSVSRAARVQGPGSRVQGSGFSV
eukprot:139301-Rhodomonas_salina.2